MTEPLVLGIETSCDETGAGLVRGRELLAQAAALAAELQLPVMEVEWGRGLVARADGDLHTARSALARAVALGRAVANHWREYECMLALATVEFELRLVDDALVAGVTATAADPSVAASAEEVAAMRDKLTAALTLLKKASKSRGYLYEQPWYAIIGPPGAGKTTALMNAGLTFPLAGELGQDPDDDGLDQQRAPRRSRRRR